MVSIRIMKKCGIMLSMLITIIVFLSSCDSIEIYESEFFTYRVLTASYKTKEKYVAIIELTEKGKEQEVIVVPKYLEGFPVKDLGDRIADWSGYVTSRGKFRSENLKAVYVEMESCA